MNTSSLTKSRQYNPQTAAEKIRINGRKRGTDYSLGESRYMTVISHADAAAAALALPSAASSSSVAAAAAGN